MNRRQRIVVAALYLRRRKRRRSNWVDPIRLARQQQGEYHNLIQEIRMNEVLFHQYFRMSVGQFDALLARVGPRIMKRNTQFRQAICPAQRLAICLR